MITVCKKLSFQFSAITEANATNAVEETHAEPNEMHLTAGIHPNSSDNEQSYHKNVFDKNPDVTEETEACCSALEAIPSSAISEKLSMILESFSQNLPQTQLQEKFGELTDVIETLHRCHELEKRGLQMRQEKDLVELSKQIELLQLNLGASSPKSPSQNAADSFREEEKSSNISEALNEIDLKKSMPNSRNVSNESKEILQVCYINFAAIKILKIFLPE